MRSSPSVFRALVLGHLLGGWVLFDSRLPMLVMVLLAALLTLSAVRQLRLFMYPDVAVFRIDADGEWHVRGRGSADWEQVEPVSVYVQPWLVIVRFARSRDWLPRALLIAADAVDPDLLRRLRVRLRLLYR